MTGDLDTIADNAIDVVNYLQYWGESDVNDINSKEQIATIVYIIIILFAVGIFTVLAAAVVRVFSKETEKINDALKEVSTGNLEFSLNCDYDNEFDEMKLSINKTVENFKGIVIGIKEKSGDIDVKAEGLSSVSSELSASVQNVQMAIENITTGTEEQAEDLNDINNVLKSFSKSIIEFIENVQFLDKNANIITDKANESSSKINNLSEAFEHVGKLIKSFTDKITVLSTTVGEISGITKFINDIAEQTNMLALNAAIESARVGEAGKGFAVVADQIRMLAEQSKESANSITSLISDVSRGTNEISKDGEAVNEKLGESMLIVNDSLASFNEIIRAIEEVACKIGELNTASNEINKEKDVIYEKVEKSSGIAKEIVSSSEEVLSSLSEINDGSKNVEDTAVDLSDLTGILEKNIQIFKTK